MYQVLEQTHEEKVKMYNENCTKEQLIEMIIECNRIIGLRQPTVSNVSYVNICKCSKSHVYYMNGKPICTTCNKPCI